MGSRFHVHKGGGALKSRRRVTERSRRGSEFTFLITFSARVDCYGAVYVNMSCRIYCSCLLAAQVEPSPFFDIVVVEGS